MNARIMVVEDEEALTTLLRYNLDAEGYDVETVGRGDDADTRLKERVPDLIVLDWMLPGLSGIELCRRLRARPETKQLPIIMLTARGEESERVRGLATGADDYIVKPFSVPELLARVKGLLRRASPERLATVLTYGDIELDREKRRVARSGGRSTSARPNIACWNSSSSIPAGCSPASNCSTASGDATSTSTSAPSTSTSAACANCSTPPASRTRSAPSAAPATRWTTGLRRRSRRPKQTRRRPGQASEASAEPGPIPRDLSIYGSCLTTCRNHEHL